MDGGVSRERAERSGRINKCLVANGNRRCHNNIPEATGMLPQLHMLFAVARDGATQSGSPVLGSKWGGGFPLFPSPSALSVHPSVPRGHPVQMGNRNDLGAASVTSLGDRVSRQ